MPQVQPFDLPNYQHPDYEAMVEPLRVLRDVYGDLEGCKERYLLQKHKEPDRAYQQRVAAATFNNKLRPVVESNAGLLSAFELANTPPSVAAAIGNLDLQGSDYKAFFQEADTLSLRDGHCFVWVDYPKMDETIVTEADRQQAKRRPYLKLIERANLLNWSTHHEHGQVVIDHVTIAMSAKSREGRYGVKMVTRYHLLERVVKRFEDGTARSLLQHTELELQDVNGSQQAVVIDSGLIDTPAIPIVCYPTSYKPFNCDNPPFLKLAKLCVKLFRKESNLDETEERVNAPTVYREWPTEVPDLPPQITFGPTWIIEIPQGGKVGILEMTGTGMDRLAGSIEQLKADIDAEGLAFLAGSRVQRTATEAFLDSAQIKASLSGYARDKASAIVRCFDFWCGYTGEKNTIEVQMDESLLEQPLDAGEVSALMGLWQGAAIDLQTLLELLKMGKQLPPGADIQVIIDRVAAERQQQMAAQVMPADDSGAVTPLDIPLSVVNGGRN